MFFVEMRGRCSTKPPPDVGHRLAPLEWDIEEEATIAIHVALHQTQAARLTVVDVRHADEALSDGIEDERRCVGERLRPIDRTRVDTDEVQRWVSVSRSAVLVHLDLLVELDVFTCSGSFAKTFGELLRLAHVPLVGDADTSILFVLREAFQDGE